MTLAALTDKPATALFLLALWLSFWLVVLSIAVIYDHRRQP